MDFYVSEKPFSSRAERYPPPPGVTPEYPCFVLSKHDWNDFGYRTRFELALVTGEGVPLDLGETKILQFDADGVVRKDTQLPRSFESLGEEFASLGQGEEYYTVLEDMSLADQVLPALQDVVRDPSRATRLIGLEAVDASLTRFSEARHLWVTRVLPQIDPDPILGFVTGQQGPGAAPWAPKLTFRCKLEGFDSPHEVTCEFRPTSNGIPSRTIAFVGRNATGKTGVMAMLARWLTGTAEPARLAERLEQLNQQQPRDDFVRVVAISYSPFGPFRYPESETSSYRRCDLTGGDYHYVDPAKRTDLAGRDAIWSQDLLQFGFWRRLRSQLQDISMTDELRVRWIRALELVGLTDHEPALDQADLNDYEALLRQVRAMSSGHQMVATLLADLITNLHVNTLVLFDEPELYLHPNMVAGLMRALEDLLAHWKSYAIVATHSPIVVQEIPSWNVRVFQRDGDTPYVLPLQVESFGENLTNLVTEVFGVGDSELNYMRILDRLLTSHTEDEIRALFPNGLSLNALAYIRSRTREGN